MVCTNAKGTLGDKVSSDTLVISGKWTSKATGSCRSLPLMTKSFKVFIDLELSVCEAFGVGLEL